MIFCWLLLVCYCALRRKRRNIETNERTTDRPTERANERKNIMNKQAYIHIRIREIETVFAHEYDTRNLCVIYIEFGFRLAIFVSV